MNASASPQSSSSKLGPIALVALLVASLALGIFVLRARTPNLALEVTSFPRSFEGKGTAKFEFFVRFDEPAAIVEIVGRNQVVARTLDPALAIEADEPITCVWDGQLDDGGAAAPGRYRLRITLPQEDRQMVFPRRLDVPMEGTLERRGYLLDFDDPCGAEDAT